MTRRPSWAPRTSGAAGRLFAGGRWPLEPSAGVDAARAIALAAVLTWATVSEAHPDAAVTNGVVVPHPPAWAYGLVTLAALVLAWRRRWPLAVLAASTTAVLAFGCLGYVDGAAMVAPAVAVYGVAVDVEIRRAVLATVAALVVLMASDAAFDPLGTFGGGFFLVPWLFVAPLFLGFAVRNRRAYLSAVMDRALAAERSRDDEAARQVDAERLRIARELHDVVAHTMALINVQAGVAEHIAAERPEQAVAALTAIKRASKEGLRELRAMLNVLRQADEGEWTDPAPRLDQIDGLLTAARAAGVPVTVRTTGTRREVPSTVDLTAYRILQESLTNAVRHSPGADTTVTLGYGPQTLTIEVVGGGGEAVRPTDQSSGPGHGIQGMRERAAAVGGTLTAAPRPGGGFAVRADLPLAADR